MYGEKENKRKRRKKENRREMDNKKSAKMVFELRARPKDRKDDCYKLRKKKIDLFAEINHVRCLIKFAAEW